MEEPPNVSTIISLGNRQAGCIFGNQSQRQSIAQVCGPFPLHNQQLHMTSISAKQNPFENLGSATDWMASFLDFQISKLEERREDIDAGMESKLPETNQDPIWN
jgi:hypothetical protein